MLTLQSPPPLVINVALIYAECKFRVKENHIASIQNVCIDGYDVLYIGPEITEAKLDKIASNHFFFRGCHQALYITPYHYFVCYEKQLTIIDESVKLEKC